VDAHLWLAQSKNVAHASQAAGKDAACWKALRPVRGLNSDGDHRVT
jgi:hypothetical protein